jgi:hypothetical protein
MLFDLKGRRRRVVQVTYVGLALLMGGGLVLSGIGSSASGGLLDALVGNGGGGGSKGDAKKPYNNQIKAAETRLRANPQDRAALATLVRAHFGLASLETDTTDQGATTINKNGVAEMKKADQAWRRYIATEPDPIDSSLALTALQIYRVVGLPKAQKDKDALYVAPARAIAEKENSVDAYVNLVGVATQAGDTRTAGLAESKALSLTTSKDEKATVKERIAAEKSAASSSASGAGGNGAAPPASGP